MRHIRMTAPATLTTFDFEIHRPHIEGSLNVGNLALILGLFEKRGRELRLTNNRLQCPDTNLAVIWNRNGNSSARYLLLHNNMAALFVARCEIRAGP